MAIKHEKVLNFIREMSVKATIRYHYTTTRTTKIIKAAKYWQECETDGTFT